MPIRQSRLFLDFRDAPQRVGHPLAALAATVAQGKKLIYERQRRCGLDHDFAILGNCVVNLIGPDAYAKCFS